MTAHILYTCTSIRTLKNTEKDLYIYILTYILINTSTNYISLFVLKDHKKKYIYMYVKYKIFPIYITYLYILDKQYLYKKYSYNDSYNIVLNKFDKYIRNIL